VKQNSDKSEPINQSRGSAIQTAVDFHLDLLTNASGEKLLRVRGGSVKASKPAELIIPASQAYLFMEAVIHFVASMEKKEMQNVIKGKRKATVKLSPQD
jgi:hypothetical protein